MKNKLRNILITLCLVCAVAFAAQLTSTVITGTLDVTSTTTVGGGYGTSGSTLSADGDLSLDDDLIVDDDATITGTAGIGDATFGGGYGDTGATISSAGVLQADGAITTGGALTADSAAIGGGYGTTGSSLSSDGDLSLDDDLIVDDDATITGTAGIGDAMFGGGYGSTGATISAAGVGQYNGALTTDATLTGNTAVITTSATFGGGYGSTGVTISDAGAIQANGAITASGYNDSNWNTAYTDRLKWDGGDTGLTAATGRTSLGLGTIATQAANSVNIDGGAIDGTTIGASVHAAATVTSLIVQENTNALATDPAIAFSAYDSTNAATTYGEVEAVIVDAANSSEDSNLNLSYMKAGTLTLGTKLHTLLGFNLLSTKGVIVAGTDFLDVVDTSEYVALYSDYSTNPAMVMREYDAGEGEGELDKTAAIYFDAVNNRFVVSFDDVPTIALNSDGTIDNLITP